MVDIVYASSGTAASGGMGSTLIMIVLMIAIFYFLLIRPENKRKKQAEEMRSSLKKGDWLTTIGGVYGRVVSVTDRTVVIETSEDRVRLEFVKSAVGAVGTLDEQAAAAPRKSKKDAPKKTEDVVEPAIPAKQEEPAAEEKSDEE